MSFLRNAWYQAAWIDELITSPGLARTILDIPLIFFFDSTGEPRALLDRCLHRFAPLSAGKLTDGVVTCAYHGLAFDGSGQCIQNPHGPVTSAMRVRSYPVVARHRALWVWMGDADVGDIHDIPYLDFIDDTPETAVIKGRVTIAANHMLMTDNIMDLSHADTVHPTTLGGFFTNARTRVTRNREDIVAEYVATDCDPPPVFQAVIPPPQRADIRIQVTWRAPAVMVLASSAVVSGEPRDPKRDSLVLHNMVPETEKSTHYFYCGTRPFQTADTDLTARIRASLEQAFLEEDKPLVEQQQARIGEVDFWSLNPIILSVDAAAVEVRKRFAALLEAERATDAHAGAVQRAATTLAA